MSRTKLLNEIDSQELIDWLAYHIIINKRGRETKQKNEQTTLREKFKAITGGRLKKNNR